MSTLRCHKPSRSLDLIVDALERLTVRSRVGDNQASTGEE